MGEKQQTSLQNIFQRTLSLTKVKSISQTLLIREQVNHLQTYQNLLYVGTNDSKVLVYEITKSQNKDEPLIFTKVAQLYPHCTFVKFIVAVKEFLVVVPQQEQQLIRIWKRQSLQIMQGYKGHEKQITKVIFLKDGQHLASVSHDSTARIWGIYQHNQFDKQKYLYKGLYPLLSIEQINSNTLALGGDDCCITLWDWKKQEIPTCVVFGHPGSVCSLTFYYPYLVSSGGDSHIKIWQIKQESVAYSNKTLSQVMYQDREELHLIKQLEGQVGQDQFFFKMPNYRMMILDTAGKILYINEKLEVTAQKFEIEYFKKIVTAKVWGNFLLFTCNESQKAKKREVNIVYLDFMNQQSVVNGFSWSKNLSAPTIMEQNQKNDFLEQDRIDKNETQDKKINTERIVGQNVNLTTKMIQVNKEKEKKQVERDGQSLQMLYMPENNMGFVQIQLNLMNDEIAHK